MRTKPKKKVNTLRGYMVIEPPNILVTFSFSTRKDFAEINYSRFKRNNWVGPYLLPNEKLRCVPVTITERKEGEMMDNGGWSEEEVESWDVAEARNFARQLMAAADQIGELISENARLKSEIKERERKAALTMLIIAKENILTGDEVDPFLRDSEYMRLWEAALKLEAKEGEKNE